MRLRTGLVLVTLLTADLLAQPTDAVQPADRFLRYLQIVRAHDAGRADRPFIEVLSWPTADFQRAVEDVKRLAVFLDRSRQKFGSDIDFYGQLLDTEEVEKLFGVPVGEILVRGAWLHADIAELVPGDATPSVPGQQSTSIVEDGREQGRRYPTIHWALGRSLLDSLTPGPGTSAAALDWYQRSAAVLLRTGALSEAVPHLSRARLIYPADPQILFASAFLHDRFASPLLQAATEAIQASGKAKPEVAGERAELQRCEMLYRQTLAITPGDATARVRLARVLGRLGRHRDALAELKQAMSGELTEEYRYYAQLFLGNDQEALGNPDAARTSFERAASLYPEAQSPHLALSQLARRRGNKQQARDQLDLLAAVSTSSTREDPWWKYYDWR
jgi:hypothetical protein